MGEYGKYLVLSPSLMDEGILDRLRDIFQI